MKLASLRSLLSRHLPTLRKLVAGEEDEMLTCHVTSQCHVTTVVSTVMKLQTVSWTRIALGALYLPKFVSLTGPRPPCQQKVRKPYFWLEEDDPEGGMMPMIGG